MKRVELIFNRSVEEDLTGLLEEAEACFSYTIHPVVFGKGRKGPRMGDHIWPEENMVYLFYVEESCLNELIEIKKKLKALFPDEGIKLYASSAEEY